MERQERGTVEFGEKQKQKLRERRARPSFKFEARNMIYGCIMVEGVGSNCKVDEKMLTEGR